VNAHELMDRLANADPESEVYFRTTESGDDLVVDIDTSNGDQVFLLGSES